MDSSVPRLRPLNLGDLLDAAIALYRRNFALFVGVVAVIAVPQAIINAYVISQAETDLAQFFDPSSYTAGELGGVIASVLGLQLISVVFGLVIMVLRRKLGKNVSNTKEILTDLKVLVTVGPKAAAERANSRRSSWVRLPYGVPLCIGFIGTLAYLHWLA